MGDVTLCSLPKEKRTLCAISGRQRTQRYAAAMCDTFATVLDDGILFAKNSDRDANESQIIEWHPAEDHQRDARLTCTWIEIPQVAVTLPILISRPWWMWGAEMGANAAQVLIGNEAVFTHAHKDEPGLLGMDLLRLALERASSADAAVEVIVTHLERYGQGGSCSAERPSFSYDNSFLIVDPNTVVVLETAGRRWATEHVSQGSRAISNGLTIEPFARANAKRLRSAVTGCSVRRGRVERRLNGAASVLDMFGVLRSHADSVVPSWSLLNGGLTAPCVHSGGLVASSQTTASLASDLRHPGLHWATGTAAPCTSVFKPLRIEGPIDLGPAPTNTDDGTSLWWRHEHLHRVVMSDAERWLVELRTEIDAIERSWVTDPPSSSDAFRIAREVEERWIDRVSYGGDRRPWFVKSRARKEAAAAGIGVTREQWDR